MYTDLLTKIRNGQQARKEMIKVPFSNMDMAILEVLEKHGYVAEAAKKGRLPKRVIEIKLGYTDNRGKIEGLKFLSKPSRHLYTSYKELWPRRRGVGIILISTSKGIKTAVEAKKEKIGGELLFEIW